MRWIGVVAALLLTGCIGPIGTTAEDVHARFYLTGYGQCPPDALRCEWSSDGDVDRLLLSGIRWAPESRDQTVGLYVDWWGMNPLEATFADVRLEGFRDAWRHDCHGRCTLHVQGAALVAGPHGNVGFDLDNGFDALSAHLDGVSVSGFRSCIQMRSLAEADVRGAALAGCHFGLSASLGDDDTLRISNLTADVGPAGAKDEAGPYGIFVLSGNVAIADSEVRGGAIGVSLFLANATLRNVTLRGQSEMAVFAYSDDPFAVDGGRFEDGKDGIVLKRTIDDPGAEIHGAAFANLAGLGIRSSGNLTTRIDARDNYWGSMLGPSVAPCIDGVPCPTGVAVPAYVDFIPFRSFP